MNKINIFRNKSLKSAMLGSLLLGSFAFPYVGNATYYDIDEEQSFARADEFCQAISDDDISKVVRLLRGFANPNLVDEYGSRPLCYANTPGMINLLFRAGADVNAKDGNGDTLLHNVVNVADPAGLEWLEALLECGARTDIRNAAGWTPLDLVEEAIKSGYVYDFGGYGKIDEDRREIFIQAKQLFDRYSRMQ
jgi:ankyrin repeat protein